MTLYLSPLTTILQFFSNLGAPLSGGTVSTYEAGTTTTTPTWTDSTGDTENANPLTLNAYGRYQSVAVWQAEGVPIKAVIADAAGNTIATLDQIGGINDFDLTDTALASPASGSGADLIANAVRSYSSFNDARSANTPLMQSGQTLVVVFEGGASAGDGLGGEFYWDASATAADDGLNTIAPSNGDEGRYLRISSSPVAAYASKNSATSRASTTTLAADPDLTIDLPSAGTYSLEGWINDGGQSSSGGLQGALAFSGTSSGGGWAMEGSGSDVTPVALTALGTAAEMQSAQAGTASMALSGYLICSTSGTLSFNWAQQSSNSTASLVGGGSWLRVTRLSTKTSGFSPTTRTYTSGSGTETIPTGASSMTVEVWSGSGGGGGSDGDLGLYGGGGGSGAYSRSVYDVSSSNGDTIAYVVGGGGAAGTGGNGDNGGDSSAGASGTFSMTELLCKGAQGGGYASSGIAGFGGTGGIASGGNAVNTAGNQGVAGDDYSHSTPARGGASIAGIYASGGAGGNGETTYYSGNTAATAGGAGLVIFRYG